MEPMTLGSPTHSPSGSPNVGYLPPFLLGEIISPSTPRANSLSPTKGRSLAFGSSISPTQTSTPDQRPYRQPASVHHQALYNQQNIYSNIPTSPNLSYSSKPNGPPTVDLFDTIKSHETTVHKSMLHDNSYMGFQNNNSIAQNVFVTNHNMNQNSAQMTSSWQDVSQQHDEHWVTVFGFPPNAANTVLARFSNCGALLDKQYPTQGNWAHIRYSTRVEKERALAMSGRQILPGIMIGVVECKEQPRLATSNHIVCSPERQSRSLCPTPLSTAPVPQRSTGLVSKALDYVFGW